MAFTDHRNDDEIIASVLDAIAADGNADLVAAALREAWNGRDFDDTILRGAFSALAAEEAA